VDTKSQFFKIELKKKLECLNLFLIYWNKGKKINLLDLKFFKILGFVSVDDYYNFNPKIFPVLI
jgi:hypothetical protein